MPGAIRVIVDPRAARWGCAYHLGRPAAALIRYRDHVLLPACADCIENARALQLADVLDWPAPSARSAMSFMSFGRRLPAPTGPSRRTSPPV